MSFYVSLREHHPARLHGRPFSLLRKLLKCFAFIILHHICPRTAPCLRTLQFNILKHKSLIVSAYIEVIQLWPLLFLAGFFSCFVFNSFNGSIFPLSIHTGFLILKMYSGLLIPNSLKSFKQRDVFLLDVKEVTDKRFLSKKS